MAAEESVRKISTLLTGLGIVEETRVDILKRIFAELPTASVSPSFEQSLVVGNKEPLPPLLDNIYKIIRSETDYLQQLEDFKRNFILPLQTGEVKVKFNPSNTIFGLIDVLINIHKEFLDKFKNSYDSYPNHQLTNLFMDIIPSLQIYAKYVQDYSINLYQLEKEQQSSTLFTEFITKKEIECGGFSLKSKLALPLNRITRYCTFIQESIDELEAGDKKEVLLEASVGLQEKMNACFEISNNMDNLIEIEKLLVNTPENFSLCDPHRILVKKGNLKIITGKEKKSHFIYLFNDSLLVTVPLPKVKQYRFVEFLSLQYSSLPLIEGLKFNWEDSHLKKIHFLTSSKQEKSEWVEAFGSHIDALQEKEVFGLTVAELLKREPDGTEIPSIVEKLVGHVEKYCTELSGVFRISGSATLITEAKDLINRGIDIDLETLDDHVATGLLKQFLREMEDTVIPSAQYNDFIACAEEDNVSRAISKFLLNIPEENYRVLKRIMTMLHLVASKEDVNMMNASNLAIVFGVNLARDCNSDSLAEISFGDRPLFEEMITNYNSIFSSFRRAGIRGKRERMNRSKSLIGIGRVSLTKSAETTPIPPSTPPVGKLERETKLTSTSNLPTVAADIKLRKNRTAKKSKTKVHPMKDVQVVKPIRERPRRTLLLSPEQLLCYCCSQEISKTSYAIFIDAEHRCHQNCFVCSGCDVPLEFGNFEIDKKKLFCVPCSLGL